MNCPICNSELDVMKGISECVLGCPKCRHIATRGLRESLDIAVDALNAVTATPLNSRVIHDVADKALEQIEQKD